MPQECRKLFCRNCISLFEDITSIYVLVFIPLILIIIHVFTVLYLRVHCEFAILASYSQNPCVFKYGVV